MQRSVCFGRSDVLTICIDIADWCEYCGKSRHGSINTRVYRGEEVGDWADSKKIIEAEPDTEVTFRVGDVRAKRQLGDLCVVAIWYIRCQFRRQPNPAGGLGRIDDLQAYNTGRKIGSVRAGDEDGCTVWYLEIVKYVSSLFCFHLEDEARE